MLDLTISIVTTQDAERLLKCIKSIYDNISESLRFEVVVVDNANHVSADLESLFPRVRLIKNNSIKGFSENHNNVIRQSSGDHVLVMNPDVYIQKGFVESMLKVITGGEKIGIVAGKLLQPDRKTIDSTGHIIYKSRRTFDRGQGQVDSGQYNAQEEVFSACAAAMLCRREMLEDIKLFGEYFDESFKLYKEDLDLCWRARLRGWKIVYSPDAVAYHERGWGKGRSRVEIPRWIRRESFKNRYLTMIKNDHFYNFLRDLPFIMWHELKALVYVIFREPHLFLAWGQVLMSLPLTFRKRAEVMKRAVVGPDEIRKWFV